MKKFLITLIAIICFGISANALVFRGTNKMCGGGATLTLKSDGSMVFYYNYHTYDGTYSAKDGYIHLYENGEKFISLPYEYSNNTLNWVDLGGTKMYKCR
ncbi:MAG: hypothetical protein LBT56_01040 [Prevotellaceae bacterium]|jgi:hypothetical protein|nr:hypothetical protein [Prevotellaceae bacterium]